MTAECKEGVVYKFILINQLSVLGMQVANLSGTWWILDKKKPHNAKHNDNLDKFKHFNNIICSIPGCKHESATTCIFKMCLDILCIDFKFL